MMRPSNLQPEHGEAQTRPVEAARGVIRAKGFAATSIEDLCKAVGVTKSAFFHYFESEVALGVGATVP